MHIGTVSTKLTHTRTIPLLVCLLGCSGEGDANNKLSLAWKFGSGDCASNKVEKVKVTVTPPGGASAASEFACAAGAGDLGDITTGSYGIKAEGLDGAGTPRFEASMTASFPDGKVSGPLDLTLRPKASNVNVTWNGCPPGVVQPYFVALYRPPTSGTALTNKVKEVQESCQAKRATLESIAPGDYVVEVNSRAVTPAVRGTKPVTVVAGQDVEVALSVP
ncbi:MAG: hypothetical protein IPG50_31870 [Myxococcales bacterium]|nr:hypothetical protein [Myxococcales bacterium]